VNIKSNKKLLRVAAFFAATGLILGLGAAAQSAIAAPTTVETRSASSAKPTIVLVHGAWADGSSFGPVTAALQIAGYKVVVAPNPLRGVQSDSDYLTAFVQQATTGPVVLVGHSYGGIVITNAARNLPTVKALVYVDAYAPEAGESAQSLNAAQPGSLLNVSPETVFNFVLSPGMTQPNEYDLLIQQDKFKAILGADLPTLVTNGLAAGQRPVNSYALGTPSGDPAWKTIPSWFFIGTKDMVIPAAEQRIMAQRAGGTVTEAPASHLAMLSKPLQVTQVIVSAAKSVK
jgi:pimeloyl-ACP methyl ester carboxylesterase